MPREIRIGKRAIGDSAPVFLVAETGTNHNGKIGLALRMIEAAKRCGADAVKFQTIAPDSSYIKGTAPYEVYKKICFKKEEWFRLRKAAKDNDIIFFSAPADIPSARLCKDMRMPAIKISSGSMTNMALVREVAGYGLPVILSTGMSYMAEIKDVIAQIRKKGIRDIMIMHCTSVYPAPANQLNLNAITTLKKELRLPIGYSDHTTLDIPSLAAVCLGARIIEKHFTIDKKAGGPEQEFSYDEDRLKKIFRDIRYLETALGSPIKRPAGDELKIRNKARRCLVANSAIEKGQIITEAMIGMKRPLTKPGLSTAYFEKIIGKRAARCIGKDSPIYAGCIKR